MKVWIILSLLVFAIIASQGQAANIALNKPARQSSELNQRIYPASKAVNGRKTDFSHTGYDGTVKWWKVDLEGDYLIKNVIIYNRLGCCGDGRLRQFYVLTSNISDPGDPSNISDKWIIRHYQQNGIGTGAFVDLTLYTTDRVRHVAVYTINTKPLNLAEVEVYNYSRSEGQASNIALTKPAYQSSEYEVDPHPASKAVNGIKTNVDDYSHTNPDETVHWWKVHLEGDYLIKNVIIYNRLDCCGNGRLREFYALTSDLYNADNPSPIADRWIIRHYQHNGVAAGAHVNFNLYTTDTVWQLAVYTINTEPLNLAEVEVYSYSHSKDAPRNQVDASSADWIGSTESSLNASQAVDGNTNMFTGPHVILPPQVSWTVKLMEACDKCYIRVYPHLGKDQSHPTPSTKLLNVQIYTSGGVDRPADGQTDWVSCAKYTEDQKGPLLQYCDSTSIRFVRLQNVGTGSKDIGITEIQVFSREPAEFQNIHLQNQNYGCVNISTSPATVDRAICYRWKCTGNQWSNRRSSTSVQSCGHEPGSRVTCEVVAVGEGGVYQSQLQEIALNDCQDPSKATFNVKDIGTNDEKTARKISVYNIQVETNCDSLKTLTISVKEQDQEVRSKMISDLTADVSFGGLKADTNYIVHVTAINKRDKSSISDDKSVTTGELAPGKVDSVIITENSHSCISVQWAKVPLDKRNGTITSYEVKCGVKSEVNIPVAHNRSYEDCGFATNSEITCSVKAVNGFGTGEGLDTSIFLCGLPAPPTFNLNESLSIDGLWRVLTVSIINVNDLKCESLTQVEVVITNGSHLVYQKNLTNHESSDLFGQLAAVTNLTVKLIAVNKYGYKSQPTSKWITTGELAPWSPPDRVKLDLINSTCGLLTWRKPVQSNGVILYYQTLCNNTAAVVFDDYLKATKTEVEQLTFCGLKPASLVECSVRANTSVGWSRVAADRGYTTLELTKPLEITEVIDSSEEQVTVQIAAVQFTSDNPIMYYQIIVEKVSTRTRRSTDDSVVDVDFLYNSTTAQTLNLTYYIAGRLYNQTDDFIRFTCGDNHTYGGYYNQPLETDTFYKIHYTYSITVGGELTTYSGPAIDVRRKPTTSSSSPPGESTISYAAFGALALLLIIPAVIGFLVMRKRRKRGPPPNISEREVVGSSLPDIPNSTLSIQVQSDTAETSMSLKPNRDVKRAASSKTNSPYVNVTYKSARNPVNISSVVSFDKSVIKKYIKNGEKTRVEQYAAIELIAKGEMIAALDEKNKGKNRYKGIYPVDEYRVILNDNPGRTDYINASYIPGYHKTNRYIAAMGPKIETLDDFWVMIWEQNVDTIIMLTRVIEDGKNKCERYWPQVLKVKEEKFGGCTITMTAEESWAGFVVRTLYVKHKDGGHRKITQYHYLTWPDHGVPKHTAPFVMFYNLIIEREHGFNTENPVLVHCSAGVGRTGTFIGLDYLVDQGKSEGKIDFYDCVRQMRSYRPAMVQREEQYHFLHAALLEYLMAKQSVTDVSGMLEKLSSYSCDPDKSVVSEEYMMIADELANNQPNYSSSTEEMINKNADPHILPDETRRIYLCNAPSNYINAVIVPSFKNSQKFIVTQVPLTKTIRDFWVMIHERRVRKIVQLETTEVEFLPLDKDKSLKLTNLTVKFIKSSKMESTEIIKLQLLSDDCDEPEQLQNEDVITVYRYTLWSSLTIDDQTLIKLYDLIKRDDIESSESYMVMCRNGALKSGLYVNLYNILQKLELEQMVDVYRSVLSTRLVRPQFIPDIETYTQLYQIVNRFAENFSEYANFQ